MYLLDPKTMRVRLRKDAEQFSLFGGDPTPVALTPKGRRAKKQREKWGTQTELFPSNQFSVPTLKPKPPKAAKPSLTPKAPKAPKAPLQPKAPKAPGAGGRKKIPEGTTRIKDGRQEILKNSRWRPVAPKDQPAPGLAVLRDEPATVAPVFAPAKPEPTPVSTPEPAIAPTPTVEPAPAAFKVGDTVEWTRSVGGVNELRQGVVIGQQGDKVLLRQWYEGEPLGTTTMPVSDLAPSTATITPITRQGVDGLKEIADVFEHDDADQSVWNIASALHFQMTGGNSKISTEAIEHLQTANAAEIWQTIQNVAADLSARGSSASEWNEIRRSIDNLMRGSDRAPAPTTPTAPAEPPVPSLEAIERIVAESLKGVFKVEHTPDPKQVKYIADDIKRSIDLHGLDHVADAKHKLISTISNLSRKAANYTTPDGDLRSSGHWYTNAQADHALQRIFAELESSFGSPTPGTDKGIEDIEAIHNILYKPGLSSADAEKVEAIAGSLLQTLRSKGLFADAWWRDKESTKDAVRQSIRDFLYDENTGLPVDGYTEDEVIERADRVFIHVFRSQRPADRPSRSTTPPTPAEPDTSHLSALEESLFREQRRLREAKTDRERQMRQVWVDQKQREIQWERKRLGLPEDELIEDLSDDDLLAELTGEATPAEPPAPSLESDADFASTKRQEERIAVNQAVRDLLAQKPDGPYSQDELTLLAKYSGKGGITQDEGSLSEYYTRPDVAKFTTNLLYQNGYQGGVVLEPSCGNGVFLHQLKSDPNTLAVGVELDSTSGQAAAALNPHADVNHGVPFERFLLDNPNITPDAIVGNVPFGTRTVEDLEAFRKVGKGWKDNGDFFVHESLSRLKPGGTMALIVPHGITTGKNHQKLRRELMKQGRVVGAYRLPNTAFAHTGTQTITDILVIQKHPDAVLNAIAQKDQGVIASTRDDAFIHGKYFEENPEHILGTVRAITNQYGGESFTVDGSVEDALAKAPPLAPKVTYDGLNLPTQDEDGPQQGDEKYIGGRLYRFEGHPGRWHLVPPGDGVEAEEGADPSAYGTGSMAEAEAILKDPGQRVMIDPENLRAMAQLAGSTLTPAEAAAVKDASMAVDQMGSTVDKAKLAHAMLLAGHLQRLQKMGTDDPIHLEQALAMLQAYREAHGNPATDRSLSALAKQLPALLHLQGAFDEEGTISDYFANHEAVMEQAKRSHSEAGAAMGEAFRAAGGEAVTLGEIRQHLEVSMTDDDLAAALAADPTVGYMGGGYMPLERLLVGNGFNLMDALLMEADTLPEGSPLRRKLEEQVGMIRARLQPRAMEDITTPFWAVGSWIPVDALNAFLEANDYHLRVGYNPLASKWQAIREGDDHVFASDGSVYGLKGDILSSMNRERLSHGSKTKEAKEAIAALEQRFGQWLSGSDYRLQVEEAYNVAFNGDLPQEFSGEPLDIPLFEQHGGDPENGVRAKRLHDYQNSTIRQMAEQGRGIIALDVGLGKTATSIALALHLKAEGRAKKPTFVVPKSVLANWVKEVGVWAPNANVMVVGQTQQFWKNGEPAWAVKGYKTKMQDGLPARDANGNYILFKKIGTEERVDASGKTKKVAIYDTEPTLMGEKEYRDRGRLVFKDDSAEEKNRKLRLLANNAYDIVLMTEPVFQGIKLDTATESQYIRDLADDGKINPDAKDTHKKLEQIATREAALAARSGEKNETVGFEELGVDCLIHDEAHHLKNLMKVGGRNTGTAFLSTAESDRAIDFYNKSRYIRERNNNQNTFLLTATPLTNNPVEVYNMLLHVAPEEFERRGIQSLDDFLGMFGAIEAVTVPDTKGELVEKQGLIGFKNLLDLSKLSRKYTRKQNVDQVNEIRRSRGDALMHVPEAVAQTHDVDMTPTQRRVYEALKARVEALASQGNYAKEKDHLFSIISDMDKVAISLEYYNEAGSIHAGPVRIPPGEKSPKLLACANEVMSVHKTGGKQLVFCDSVAMHEQIKAELVAAGYPEDQIAIVNAGTAPKSDDRQYISDQYNDGQITLVIGNTATMGEGMNFQIETTDIHHLTFPWTPAHIQQRNGRGVRQGNVLDSVNIHTYQAQGSFDGYRVATLERKTDFIEPFWAGQVDRVENMDRGTVSAAEARIMMADDPEEARRLAESDTAAMQARHSAKMTGQAMKQFGQLQTMKLALSKMAPDQRNSERGRALADRIRATTDALGRNQHFPHKDLLDGATPAYVGTDGTVLKVGDHVQKANGAVYRIESIDPASGRMSGTNVSGRDGAPTLLEKDPLEVKFNRINNHKAHDGVKPIAFDTAAHAERVIDSISTYSEVARLDAHSLNANRDRILEKLRGPGYHKRVPYLDPSTNLVEEGNVDDMPPGAQVMWPHDGDALEHVLRTMTDPRKERDSWRYQTIAATLAGGSSWHGVAADLKPRIDAYREQHRAMTEQGPKEGDTRINQAGNQEVFRSGRWHRVGEDAPASTGAGGSTTLNTTGLSLPSVIPQSVQNALAETKVALRMGDMGIAVPDGHIVLNASRPLPGHQTGEGDFMHGRFYSFIDPTKPDALRLIEEAKSLDGWVAIAGDESAIKNISLKEIESRSPEYRAMYDRLKERNPDRADRVLIESLQNLKGKSFGEISAYLAQPSEPAPVSTPVPETMGALSGKGKSQGWQALANELGTYKVHQFDILAVIEARNEQEDLKAERIKEFEAKIQDLFQYVRDSDEGNRLIVKINSDIPEDEIYTDFAKIYRKYKVLHRKTVGEYFFKEMDDLVNKLCDDFEAFIRKEQPPAPAPDPAQAIADGMMALYRADEDGATERNGLGFDKLHSPYERDPDTGERRVKNQFVASMIERIEAGEGLTPNQIAACANVLTKYRNQLKDHHGVILPSTEDLKAYTDEITAEKKPERAAPTVSREGWTRQDWAKEIVAALKEDAMAHGFEPNVWDKKGSMRIYLNTDGPRTGPGFIDVHPDGTISNETTLPDNHPALEIALNASKGFKQREQVALGGDKPPGREIFARYLEQEINNYAAGDVKAAVWTGGRHVRVYLNDPTKDRKSGGLGFIDVGMTGITTGGGLKSNSPLYQLAADITNSVVNHHGRLEKAARRYTLAGVAYELCRTADRVFLKKVAHAF